MRAFVTGADGFVGQWLIRRLLNEDAEVTAMMRGQHPVLTTLGAGLAGRVRWVQAELRDGQRVCELIGAAKPQAIFHLGGQSSVPASIQDPAGTIETNVMGTINVLEAASAAVPDAAVLVVGSADSYGQAHASQLPLREDTPLRPLNPYAASKAAAEIVALQYARSGRCRAIATRSFNHAGPGQSPAFAVASFAKQITAIKGGRQPSELRVGDLSPRRDYSDVRDVADAYARIAARGRMGAVYNVCSGEDHSMRQIVEALARIAGVTIGLREDPSLVRAVDTPVLRGDPALLAADTGWRATTPLETTLADMLEYESRVAV